MVLNVSFCLDLVVWFVDIVCGFLLGHIDLLVLFFAFVCALFVAFVTSAGGETPPLQWLLSYNGSASYMFLSFTSLLRM